MRWIRVALMVLLVIWPGLCLGLPVSHETYLKVYDYSKGWVSLGVSLDSVRRLYNLEHLVVASTYLKVFIYDERNHKLEVINESVSDLRVNHFLVVMRSMDSVYIYDVLKGGLERMRLMGEVLQGMEVNYLSLLLFNAGMKEVTVPMALIITNKRTCVYHGGVGFKCYTRRSYYDTSTWKLSSSIAVFTDGDKRPIVYDPMLQDFVEGSMELSGVVLIMCPLRAAAALSNAGIQLYDPFKRKWVRRLGDFRRVSCDYRGLWVSSLTGYTHIYVFGQGWL